MQNEILLSSIHLQEYMDEQGVPGKIVFLDAMTKTVVQAAVALKISPDQIIKSILFIINDEPVIAISIGTRSINKKFLRKHFDASKRQVRLAKGEEIFDITGYKTGTLPPFGHKIKIKTLIDPSVLECHTVFGGGGDLSSMVQIESKILLEHTGAEVVQLAR